MKLKGKKPFRFDPLPNVFEKGDLVMTRGIYQGYSGIIVDGPVRGRNTGELLFLVRPLDPSIDGMYSRWLDVKKLKHRNPREPSSLTNSTSSTDVSACCRKSICEVKFQQCSSTNCTCQCGACRYSRHAQREMARMEKEESEYYGFPKELEGLL